MIFFYLVVFVGGDNLIKSNIINDLILVRDVCDHVNLLQY